MTESDLVRVIRTEMANRGMNNIEFAALVGVSHTTIGRILNGETKKPDLDFIVNLSIAIHMDVGLIVSLIRPDAYRITPTPSVLNEQIKRLPKEQRVLIETLILGWAEEARNNIGKQG